MRHPLPLALLATACATAGPHVRPLPKDFHWGVATSGFQSEGSFPDSNWSRYAKDPAWGHEPYRDSVDFFHRYPEDVKLAAGLGLNTFRFSIEWARVMPRRGEVDLAALEHYDRLFDAITAAGMTPMVTLLHFVIPGWVVDEGGLESDTTVEAFSDFVRRVGERYRGRGSWWVVINEPSYFLTLERRHDALSFGGVSGAKERLVKMHRDAYATLHALDATAKVSSNVVWEPAPASWFDDWFFDRVTDTIDYVALDYYYALTRDLTIAHAATGHFWKVNFSPEGLLDALRDYHRRVPQLPVWVVENGMALDEGRPRRDGYARDDHLRDHVYWLQRARDEGIDVVGFNVWSLTDNYEWGDYRNRFGLYSVDVATDPKLRRRPTEGVEALRALVRGRGVPPSYAPRK